MKPIYIVAALGALYLITRGNRQVAQGASNNLSAQAYPNGQPPYFGGVGYGNQQPGNTYSNPLINW